MKFKTYRTSDTRQEEIKEFDTLEDFMTWCKSVSNPSQAEGVLVIANKNEIELEIYDYYRE